MSEPASTAERADNRSEVDVLFSTEAIADRVDELGGEISRTMDRNCMVIAVLKGSFVFCADLIRSLHRAGMHPRIDFLTLSSYGTGTESSGEVKITRDITDDVAGMDVLLLDDILESGRTMAFAKELIQSRGAKSVSICVFLDKPNKRKVTIDADHVGFTCPDQFVVGYGLDYAHYYRELPFVGVLRQGADAD
ncbi:MAG: hypoxanthine phosphoribosyltransferase [Alphaproteobacteria bacterium]